MVPPLKGMVNSYLILEKALPVRNMAHERQIRDMWLMGVFDFVEVFVLGMPTGLALAYISYLTPGLTIYVSTIESKFQIHRTKGTKPVWLGLGMKIFPRRDPPSMLQRRNGQSIMQERR